MLLHGGPGVAGYLEPLARELADSFRVLEPFQRLIALKKLHTYRYDGFWQCMDTFKDKQRLDELMERDAAPWQVWKHGKR